MKQNITVFLLFLSLGLNSQTIFVNHSAIGLNNGTSWVNAYLSLDAALAAAIPGQSIWVAAGTYTTINPAPNNSFLITDGTKIYGGFAGGETNLSDRNIAVNTTILDGDILGNDVAGDSLSHVDNSLHVVVTATFVLTDACVVDGFTIQHGQTLVGAANADLTRRGGGLMANTKTIVRNCIFTDNFGDSGAALAALDVLSDGLEIDNCIFENNTATTSGIVFLRSTPSGVVKNSIFRNNTTNRGALYPSRTGSLTVDGCLFESNVALAPPGENPYYGAGMWTWQANYSLTNCTFRTNVADNAAGLYCDNREFMSTCTISNCTFEDNETMSYGGTAAWFNRGDYTMTNCSFLRNTAPTSGAAMYQSADTKFHVSGCLFEANTGTFAAAIANYGIRCVGTFEDCMFKENVATNGGGAVSNGFKADVKYKNCQFIGNMAGYGGAIFTQNDTTRLGIDGCLFEQNATSSTAGAVFVNAGIAASITNSTFLENVGSVGGALQVNGDSLIAIDKCIFLENIATEQGAAINFNNAFSVVTNCLLAGNLNTGSGAGGGISNNAGDSTLSTVKLVNCTVADNFAILGAGIAQWESDLGGNASLELLNCLIQNPDGSNYEIEDGTPQVITLNGNQSSDASLSAYLNGSLDLHNTSNNFQDPSNGDYAHMMADPASNGGEATGAPADDINGTPRSMVPDVGAYEVNTVGISNPRALILDLQFAPNPATDYTLLSLQNERNGQVQITIWNHLGQQVARYNTEKTSGNFTYQINTAALAAGTYKVRARLGAAIHEGAFAKF